MPDLDMHFRCLLECKRHVKYFFGTQTFQSDVSLETKNSVVVSLAKCKTW